MFTTHFRPFCSNRSGEKDKRAFVTKQAIRGCNGNRERTIQAVRQSGTHDQWGVTEAKLTTELVLPPARIKIISFSKNCTIYIFCSRLSYGLLGIEMRNP